MQPSLGATLIQHSFVLVLVTNSVYDKQLCPSCVEHGDECFRYNNCYTIMWKWSNSWPLLSESTPIRDSFAALAIGAQDWVCLTRRRGMDLRYPLSRVPAHPLRALVVCALGSTLGDNGVNMYHGLTVAWCCPTKCFEK